MFQIPKLRQSVVLLKKNVFGSPKEVFGVERLNRSANNKKGKIRPSVRQVLHRSEKAKLYLHDCLS
jgi:hypothetical protein